MYQTEPETPAVKKGDRVVVKAGTVVRSCHPQKKVYTLKRSQTVTVHLYLRGYAPFEGQEKQEPEISWAGTGGYWCYAKLSDCEIPPTTGISGIQGTPEEA